LNVGLAFLIVYGVVVLGPHIAVVEPECPAWMQDATDGVCPANQVGQVLVDVVFLAQFEWLQGVIRGQVGA
jgi:hypothetical protein